MSANDCSATADFPSDKISSRFKPIPVSSTPFLQSSQTWDMYSSIVEDLRRDKVALIARVAALQKDIEEMRKDHAEALQDMRSRHQQKFLEATVTIRNKHRYLSKCMLSLQRKYQDSQPEEVSNPCLFHAACSVFQNPVMGLRNA